MPSTTQAIRRASDDSEASRIVDEVMTNFRTQVANGTITFTPVFINNGRRRQPITNFQIARNEYIIVSDNFFKRAFRHRQKTHVRATLLPAYLDNSGDVTKCSTKWIDEVHLLARSSDQGRHIIANRLGGFGFEDNIFPQDSAVIFLNFQYDYLCLDQHGKLEEDGRRSL